MSKRLKYLLTFILAVLFSPNFAPANDLVNAARDQVGKTIRYDSTYQTLDYPGGDIPFDRGVCTDVVIRALRQAYDFDLQQLVHEDMKNNFSKYPQIWSLIKPDKNIDHRRVLNLEAFFKRQGWSLNITRQAADYKPGDLVTCIVPLNLPHIMIVSDRSNRHGTPLVIHNIGQGTQEEDRLFEFELTGHYRLPMFGDEDDTTSARSAAERHIPAEKGIFIEKDK